MAKIDQKTLAYVNLYGVLGGLVPLCEQAPEAAKILGNKGCSIGFAVKNGPQATFTFLGGRCILKEGAEDCTVKIPFSSCEKFNGMIAGTVKPIPTRGLSRLPFLIRQFGKLTDLLEAYLRPDPARLADEDFLHRSTMVMFRVVAASVAQIANHDPVGQFSASNIVDGAVKLEIADCCKAALLAKDHALTFSPKVPKDFRSYMQFGSVTIARDLFDGRINAVAAVGDGSVRVGGMVSMVDNVNRILSRVELYLK